MRRILSVPILALLVLAAESAAWAFEEARSFDDSTHGITEVRVTGPSWDDFTNLDGSGLYHDLLNQVFGLYGIRMIRGYAPSCEAYELVRQGSADMMTCHDRSLPGLLPARLPMYAGKYYVFFRRAAVGEWSFPDSLAGRTVIWRSRYYGPEHLPVPMRWSEAAGGLAALNEVIEGRQDFYLDDLNLIEESLRGRKQSLNMEDYGIEPVGERTYHPLVKDSQRGRTIMDLYDRGMEELNARGLLRPIFEKWGFPLPEAFKDGAP